MFDLADASNRLARWRLRLLEFDFEVRYRKGCENTVADAISRLPTFGHTHIAPDLDIPCLAVESENERRLCCTPRRHGKVGTESTGILRTVRLMN